MTITVNEDDVAAIDGAVTGEALPVLAVDLDESLIRSDMLHESLWAALSRHDISAVRAMAQIVRGKAALKAALANSNALNPASLPYDARVLDQIVRWRERGGRVALVTAANTRIAHAVADHLGLFDAVHASGDRLNLKGSAKAAFLVETYGAQGFVYIGDNRADLRVWSDAAGAITVDAPASVRAAVDRMGRPAEHLLAEGSGVGSLIRALRPHQWLKNVLVFLPVLSDPSRVEWAWGLLLMTFVALSLVASAGYVINDLLDLEDDRTHPRKRNRPFASGALSVATGTRLIPVLLLLGLATAALVSVEVLIVVIFYFVLTLAYSISLKEHSIIDICTLAGLYTIRMVAGSLAVSIGLSVWLLAFSLFIFFSLAAAKRLGELSDADAAGRKVTRRGYTVEDRRILSQMAISAGYVGVLVLALYIDEPYVQERFGAHRMFWGVCALLIFWLSRVALVANRGEMHDDPMVWSLKDRVSLATIVLIVLMVVWAILA